MQTTEEGVVYYVNHISKRTSWDPPRMSTDGTHVVKAQKADIRKCCRFVGYRMMAATRGLSGPVTSSYHRKTVAHEAKHSRSRTLTGLDLAKHKT